MLNTYVKAQSARTFHASILKEFGTFLFLILLPIHAYPYLFDFRIKVEEFIKDLLNCSTKKLNLYQVHQNNIFC